MGESGICYSYFSNPGSFKSLYSGGGAVSPSQGYWFSVDSILKDVPGEGCEETAGQILWGVLSKCSVSADCPPVPAGSSGVNNLPCPISPSVGATEMSRPADAPLPPPRERRGSRKQNKASLHLQSRGLALQRSR